MSFLRIERINACGHFEGEPYDVNNAEGRERKAFLDESIRELRCKNLKNEQKAIKEKYKKSQEVLPQFNVEGDEIVQQAALEQALGLAPSYPSMPVQGRKSLCIVI